MKRFVEGIDRGQSTLFPERLDDWICDDNPVRVIDVFVDAKLFENNIQMTHVVREKDRKQILCREILRMVPILEEELRTKSSTYFWGDDLSLVDAVMAPTLRFVPVWSAILDDETWDNCVATQAYLERLSEHPSVTKRAFAAPIGIYEDFYRAILVEGLTIP